VVVERLKNKVIDDHAWCLATIGPLSFMSIKMTNEPRNGRARRRRRKGAGAARLKGRSWEARWSENGERRTQAGFATKSDAEAFVEQRARKVVLAEGLADLGLFLSAERPKAAARTIGSLADEWFGAREREGIKTVHEDRWRWDRHIAPYVSSRTPDSVEEKDLHRWVAALRNPEPASKYADRTRIRPISGPTAQRSLHLLSAFYRWAIREGHATRNPCHGLRRDPGMAKMLRSTHTPDSTVVLQSKSDLERLYRTIPTDYVAAVRQPAERKRELSTKLKRHGAGLTPKKYVFPSPVPIAYLLSALAGLRPGEVLPLEWADVDLDRRRIHVRRNYRNGVISLPKSGKGREVPIVPYLLHELCVWRKKRPNAVLVCPPVRKSTRGETCFLSAPLIKRMLDAACDSCGFARGDFYDLGRRSFATLAAKAGLNPYRLKEIMGHASIETTMRYVRFASELSQNEIAALDIAS
jgi:integrase